MQAAVWLKGFAKEQKIKSEEKKRFKLLEEKEKERLLLEGKAQEEKMLLKGMEEGVMPVVVEVKEVRAEKVKRWRR